MKTKEEHLYAHSSDFEDGRLTYLQVAALNAMDTYARQEVKAFAEWLLKEDISILDSAFWKYPFTDRAEEYTKEEIIHLYQNPHP